MLATATHTNLLAIISDSEYSLCLPPNPSAPAAFTSDNKNLPQCDVLCYHVISVPAHEQQGKMVL